MFIEKTTDELITDATDKIDYFEDFIYDFQTDGNKLIFAAREALAKMESMEEELDDMEDEISNLEKDNMNLEDKVLELEKMLYSAVKYV